MPNIISSYFTNMNKVVSRTSFIFILILIEIYFLINGRAHFPNWDESYNTLVLIYLVMTLTFLVWSGRETRKQIDRPLHLSIGSFVGFFILTYFLLAAVTTLSGSSIVPVSKDLYWQTIIIQVCVVATAEELMFRGVLLERFGILLSSLLFAVWHSYAYGVMYYAPEMMSTDMFLSLGIAFFMGIILALIAKKWGISASIGCHSAYNLTVIGVFVTWSLM